MSKHIKWPHSYQAIRSALIEAQIKNASVAPSKHLRDVCEKEVDRFLTGKVVWRWSPEREQIEEEEA